MKYIVVKKERASELEERVNYLITKGYIPQGGISMWERGGLSFVTVWAQALVKPDAN